MVWARAILLHLLQLIAQLRGRRHGHGVCKYPRTGGILHYGGTENQFLSTCLAVTTQSGRNGSATRPHDRLRRMHYYRPGKPAGRESGFHVHGSSRPKSRWTVIASSLPRAANWPMFARTQVKNGCRRSAPIPAFSSTLGFHGCSRLHLDRGGN